MVYRVGSPCNRNRCTTIGSNAFINNEKANKTIFAVNVFGRTDNYFRGSKNINIKRINITKKKKTVFCRHFVFVFFIIVRHTEVIIAVSRRQLTAVLLASGLLIIHEKCFLDVFI